MTIDFNTLRKLNVSEYIEKKGNLSYLSWTYAVDTLLQNDPKATWTFDEPKYYGETMMVQVRVNAFEKSMMMQLPVMDNRNQAIKNPDSRKISDAQMRCLAKCIACFGIGLYIYAGEDLPEDATSNVDPDVVNKFVTAINESDSLDTLKTVYLTACRYLPNDAQALKLFETAKDKRKAELS